MKSTTTLASIFNKEDSSYFVLHQLWYLAIEMNLSIAVFRTPNTSNWQLIIDCSDEPQKLKVDLEELPTGFVPLLMALTAIHLLLDLLLQFIFSNVSLIK